MFEIIINFLNDSLSFLATNPFYIYGIPIVAVYLSYKMNFVQFMYFKLGWKKLLNNSTDNKSEGISSFKSAAISVGGRVGSGNIAGVTFAMIIGGPGAIFWMWVVALFVMATAFSETVLGQLYKEKNSDHIYVGGPSYYIRKGLGSKYKLIAVFYSLAMILSFGTVFISMHTDVITSSVYQAFGIDLNSTIGISILIIIAGLVAYSVFGGMKKISTISGIIVPIMTIGYLIMVGIIVIFNISFIPTFFQIVISNAFTSQALIGGGFFLAFSNGVRRGIFSNEAGQGSGAIAGASADVMHPVEQGAVQMITVFIDTILICSATAFVVILAGYDLGYNNLVVSNDGAQIATIAFDAVFIQGGKLLSIFLFFFAFSSILSVAVYGQQSVKYLFQNKSKVVVKGAITFYNLIVIMMVLIGPFLAIYLGQLFTISDNLSALLFYFNIFGLIMLRKNIFAVLKDYQDNPNRQFKSEYIDLDINNNAWK